MLVALNLPNAPLNLSRSKGTLYVVCLLRKKTIKLTPEEWVRQHIIHYLLAVKKYPEGLLKIEHGIQVNSLARRCDLLVCNRMGMPKLIVECKAPSVIISQLTFDQAAHYNHELQANFLFLTNGLTHFIFQIDVENKSLTRLQDLPEFGELG